MRLINNLNFNGQCREAFEFYAEALGGKITAMFPFGDMPEQPGGADSPECGGPISTEWRDKIMHAWLDIGDQAIMGCDVPPQWAAPMSGFSVSLHAETADEARRLFDALADGGQVSMPFAATFWSPGFGMLTDRFGTPWMVNTTPAETAA